MTRMVTQARGSERFETQTCDSASRNKVIDRLDLSKAFHNRTGALRPIAAIHRAHGDRRLTTDASPS